MELHGCKGCGSAVVGDFPALDAYVAMISRWHPGRAWLAGHCSKAIGAVEAAERHPVIAAVWARNF